MGRTGRTHRGITASEQIIKRLQRLTKGNKEHYGKAGFGGPLGRHCRCEFETRDVDATMATMVSQPYVNHIPTMTGGVGHEQLKRFYAYHFIPVNPPDFRLTPISRTVGTDTIVDEFIVHFTIPRR